MRAVLRLASLGAIAIACLAGTASSALAACPNEGLRTGASANLPDCRAYEQVTPVDKNDQSAPSTRGGVIYEPQVAADGNRAAFFSLGNFAGAPAGASFYLATRADGAWSTQDIAPALSSDEEPGCFSEYPWDSPDLSHGILSLGVSLICGVDEPALVAGEPRGEDVRNMFVRDNNTGAYQLIDITPPGITPGAVTFEGGSPDLSHVVFKEDTSLELFEWAAGSVDSVSLIPPSGASSCSGSACVSASGELGELSQGRVAHAVSDDGSRVFFSSFNTDSLYMREGETTIQVDATQGPGTSGGGDFMTASADGSTVLFTDSSRLTPDATGTSGNPDLYSYEVGNGKLTDLTVDATDASGADVLGLVGASEDASYLYFVADGALATNANSDGDTAISGRPNLYLWHAGTTSFIASLDSADKGDWTIQEVMGAHVTPSGGQLAFNSIRSLTGYDNLISGGSSTCGLGYNRVPSGNPNCNEVYLYEASGNRLVCASCNPSGAQPQGASWLRGKKECNYCETASNWSPTRNISEDGNRIFFDSEDGLVPSDTNGMQDVYEWERDGTGGCESSGEGGGCVYLVSSGRSSTASRFYEASANGDDVMFTTYQSLVGQDADGLGDLYDARVDGGLSGQQAQFSTPCSGDECSAAVSTALAPPSAASAIFSGAGNLASASVPTGQKSRSFTRAQKLAKALKACKREKRKHKRVVCENRARGRYGAKKKGRPAKTGKSKGRTGR